RVRRLIKLTRADGSSEGVDLLEVGRITKPHGLRGEVVVYLSSDRKERVDPGSVLQTATGPLRVVASRSHKDRWVVLFEGISTREAAEAACGTVLSAEPVIDNSELWVHELIGQTVVSADGVDRGKIESVMDNPASDLLVLESGALVPVAFIVGDPADGVIKVDTPDGLFELFD
ncbi:MAG TPA: ribosome maturation factor RimM, partial [Microthrixaceae bacterium]|nr:ribosome maturation factor RimM [Microthrixaceae bacterium]